MDIQKKIVYLVGERAFDEKEDAKEYLLVLRAAREWMEAIGDDSIIPEADTIAYWWYMLTDLVRAQRAEQAGCNCEPGYACRHCAISSKMVWLRTGLSDEKSLRRQLEAAKSVVAEQAAELEAIRRKLRMREDQCSDSGQALRKQIEDAERRIVVAERRNEELRKERDDALRNAKDFEQSRDSKGPIIGKLAEEKHAALLEVVALKEKLEEVRARRSNADGIGIVEEMTAEIASLYDEIEVLQEKLESKREKGKEGRA